MEIKTVTIEDAENISRIRRQNGVREGVLALTSERLDATLDFLNSISSDDCAVAAIENGELRGIGVIMKNRSPRRSHSAAVAIMVDTEYHGRGIGTSLMKHLVDHADNTLNLHRLELLVLTDNTPAIKLYKNFGFEIEATRKHAAVKNGKFVDEYFFGRIHRKGAA